MSQGDGYLDGNDGYLDADNGYLDDGDNGYLDGDGYLESEPNDGYQVDTHGYLVDGEETLDSHSTPRGAPSSLDALECPSYGAYGLDADESHSLSSHDTKSTQSSQPETDPGPDDSDSSEDGDDSALRDSLPRQDESIKLKDWNGEFQEILGQPDCREKYQALHDLGHDFVYAAKTYGKIIISELHMPEGEKTISSFNAGGIAGGEKYLCQGVFFKMVTDVLLSEPGDPPFWMYGGNQRNDAAAIKAAGLDLQGLINFYNVAESEDVHFPLMALIDYHGYRLIAMSILPVQKRGTLIYGSSDGGVTCSAKNKQFNDMMLTLGSKLNLKSHMVKDKRMATCGDIEGHLALDNKFYLLDFARVFPPEAPPRPATQQTGRLIYYHHLRPEFVRSYRYPLSSDAFSNFGAGDGRAREFNGRVRQATEYLYNTTIPEFAAKFDENPESNDRISSVTEELHRNGINVRHCGRVRSYCKESAPRFVLFTEMIARVLKEMVNDRLRSVTEESRVPLKIPYRMAVVTFLNELIGWDSTSGESVASEFWTQTIKDAVQKKFFQCLSDEEKKPSYDLRDSVLPAMLFQRFQQLTAIILSTQMLKELEGVVNLRELQLVVNPGDISGVGAKVKHLNVIDEAEAKMLYYEAMNTSGSRGRQLWSRINHRFEAALSSNTYSYRTLADWAASLLEESRLQLNPQTALQTLKLARLKAQTALKISENYVRGMFLAAEILLQEGARSAEGSVMQDRIFHSAIVSFIKVMKAETKYYTILLNTARSIFRKAHSNQCALPSQKRTSLLTAATMFRALLSVSAAFSPNILYEYSIVMFEYIVEASQEDHYSSHLECAALATGQALHSYFLHSHQYSLEDDRYTYSVAKDKSDFSENRFHVVIDPKHSGGQASTYECRYSPLSNLPLWIVQCTVAGEPYAEGDLYEQLRNLLSIMPYCSTFPAEEIIAVFKYEPIDSFVLRQISCLDVGIEEGLLPQKIEVFVISGIGAHPDLCADIRQNKITPIATITFSGKREIDLDPVPGSYLALRLVPRDGSSQMTLQNITFKGNHVLKNKSSKKRANLSLAMLELSDRKGDTTLENEPPLEYRLLQQTFEKQGYYLATLMQMTMVCPILRALTDAHLRKTSVTAGKVLTMLGGSSSDLKNPVREDLSAFQGDKEYGSINISHCGSVSDDVVKALSHPGLMSLDLTGDSSVTDSAIQMIANNCPALRVLNLGGCTQLTPVSMQVLVQKCQCLMEIFVWETASSESLQLLSKFKKLQKLSLAQCAGVTSRHIQEIASECVLLEELDLSECEVTSEDIKKLSTVPNLRSLALNRCSKANDAVLKCLSSFAQLRELSLEDGRMSDEPLLELVLQNGHQIESLLLPRCSGITNTLVTTIAQYCPHLKKFSAANNSQIDDNSLVYLAINCKELQSLDVSRTGVTDVTLQFLVKCCPELQELLMDDCKNINNAALDALQDLPDLKVLSVQRNHLITQSAIIKLIGKLELQSLDVSDCPHFNENSVIKAHMMRPELKLTYSLVDSTMNVHRPHRAFVRENSNTPSPNRLSRRGPSSMSNMRFPRS